MQRKVVRLADKRKVVAPHESDPAPPSKRQKGADTPKPRTQDIVWSRDANFVGWSSASRAAKSGKKRQVLAAPHDCTGGDPAKAVAVLKALVSDATLRNECEKIRGDTTMRRDLREDATALLRVSKQKESSPLAEQAGNNAQEVLTALSLDSNLRNTVYGRSTRRTVAAALLPTELGCKDEHKWKRFLGYSSKVELKPTLAARAQFLSGDHQALMGRKLGGEKPWDAVPDHARWAREMESWIAEEGQTRVVPGKHNICRQHSNSDGTKVMAFHSRLKRTNRRGECYPGLCKQHVLHYKCGTDEELHRRFLDAHPHA